MRTIEIDKDRCVQCESCVDICVRTIYEAIEEGIKANDPSRCIFCGHCVAICPEDAIQLPVVNMKEFEPVPEKNILPSADPLMALFRSRRSIRKYSNQPVEKEKIEMIIEAGRFAPTGGNLQPFRFSVVQNPEALQSIKRLMGEMLIRQSGQTNKTLEEKIKKGESLTPAEQIQLNYAESMRNMVASTQKGKDKMLWGAPVLISVYTNPGVGDSGVNAGLAGMQMSLMAEALGLGNCFIGFVVGAANAIPEIKHLMKIPLESTVFLSLIVGYSDLEFHKVVSRKPARITWA
jgi:nitroreductase/NAD-dependent dihydropyrimidine dehydrogenase PreA subunit